MLTITWSAEGIAEKAAYFEKWVADLPGVFLCEAEVKDLLAVCAYSREAAEDAETWRRRAEADNRNYQTMAQRRTDETRRRMELERDLNRLRGHLRSDAPERIDLISDAIRTRLAARKQAGLEIDSEAAILELATHIVANGLGSAVEKPAAEKKRDVTVGPGRRICIDGKPVVRISMTDGHGRYLDKEMTPAKANALAARFAELLADHGGPA